jgi:hypothetical protein
MKKLTLQINDENFEAFRTFIETLDYVSITKEIEILEWQQKEVNQRLDLIDRGEMSIRRWEEAKKKIFSS